MTQEAFARALAARHQFRRGGSLEAWIWQIAFSTALEAARKKQRMMCDDDGLVELPAPTLPELHLDPDLARALRALSPRRRMIVFLRYFADLPHSEIARTCGVSEGTVAATLAQAKQQLARALEARSPDGREDTTMYSPTGTHDPLAERLAALASHDDTSDWADVQRRPRAMEPAGSRTRRRAAWIAVAAALSIPIYLGIRRADETGDRPKSPARCGWRAWQRSSFACATATP